MEIARARGDRPPRAPFASATACRVAPDRMILVPVPNWWEAGTGREDHNIMPIGALGVQTTGLAF